MQYLKNIIIALTILLGLITFAQSETSWIKKKDKTETIKKVEEKSNSNWIKKKIKEDKKEYKKEEKEITKEVKSWITKKSKDKYVDSIDKLPENAIYFTASNETKDLLVYGYVQPDVNSKLINGYYETSKGFGYFNDGKTTCKIGSTVIDVSSGEVTARVSGECTNGIKFSGKTSQNQNKGMGFARTKDGKNRFFLDFNIQRAEIAKLYNFNLNFSKNNKLLADVHNKDKDQLNIKPNGKYYALLIGNSEYQVEWTSLTSPINDINEISKLLKNKYKFEKVITVPNATREKMFEAFENLATITTDNDYVLIYYAGHGDIKGNKSYWIPVDAKKKSIRNWINISDIENILLEIPAHHLAVMVDSCYFSVSKGSNMINEKVKSKLYQKLLSKRARLVLSSGQNEPVDDTGAGKHSIFGISFINSLKNTNNAISLREIGNEIAFAHAGMRQQPYLHLMLNWGHTNGDFIFLAQN